MFGLEKDKGKGEKGKKEEFVFDLEKELKDPQKRKAVFDKVDLRVQQVKVILRGGEDKEVFDKLGSLLHGYASLVKVISRLKL